MKKIILNIIFISTWQFLLHSQTPTNITHFTIESGLSQNSVNCIYQTREGIIWIGTQDGLNEYDGYNFTKFKYNPNSKNCISNNFITDITEDDTGNLIIATISGITIYEQNKDKFTWLKNNPDNPKSLSSNNILKVIYYNNTIWGLTNYSLEKYIGNGEFEHHYFADTTAIYDFYDNNDLLIDNKNRIWIATSSGINIFSPKNNRFYKTNNIKTTNIRCFQKDNNNNIWIGSSTGLIKYNSISSKYTNYFYNKKTKNKINTILINNNTFWIGTKNGLKTLSNTKIINFKNELINSIKNSITSIIQDKSGNIWCGTHGAGIYKLSFQKPKFEAFSNFPKTFSKMIFGLYADDNGKIWASSNSLCVIDRKTKKIIHYDNIINNTEILISCITKIDNKIWLGTNLGIFIIDPKNYAKKTIFQYFNIKKNKKIISSRIYDIKKQNKNTYWIATANGLFKFNGKTFTQYINNPEDPNSISSDIITKILIENDSIWLTTYDGLNLLNTKTLKFKHWNTSNNITQNIILDIYKENNNIYLGTSGGLTKFNFATKTMETFNSTNTNFINDLFYTVINEKNNLYLSSNYGIVKFNKKTKKITTYDKKDGLLSLEFNVKAGYKDKNGYIYYGNTNGINWTRTIDTTTLTPPPKVKITKIIASRTNLKSKIINFPDTSKTYKFDYKNSFSIYFTLPDYTYSKANKYSYKIKEIQDKWSQEQQLNFINLTGLAPGKYTLYVKGANSKGIWNQNETKLSFEIIPPFKNSLLARIIYLITFVTLILLTFLYIYRNIKKENKILHERNDALQQIDLHRNELEEKNKNITDSINYAKKIIEAILPPIKNLNNIIPENFIYFLPKDIVSGDFYWFTIKYEKIFIAAVDCTGHGIPGAFMSIIGMNLLDRLANKGISNPSVMLNMMNKEVITTLKKNEEKTHIKDGMDLSLCVIDKKRQTLAYAGAYNPAYIIRNNSIIQLKGDRKSIGNDFQLNAFTSQRIQIRQDDIIYLFTDGYTDQFGSINMKKFKFKRFRELLLSIHKYPLNIQKQKIHKTFLNWKKNYEQVDDILIIGFKPLSYLKQ